MKRRVGLPLRILGTVLLLTFLVLPVSADSDLPRTVDPVVGYSSSRVSMKVGAQKDLNSYIIKSQRDGEDESMNWQMASSITWTSGHADVATVDSKGVVTAKRAGVTRVTASFTDDWNKTREQHVIVTVSGAVKSTANSASADNNSITITEGKIIDLAALYCPSFDSAGSTLKWSSSDKEIASVSKSGQVRGRSIGKCQVTGTLTDSSGNTTTWVTELHVASLDLNNRSQDVSIRLKKGESVDLAAVYYPKYADNARVASDFEVSTSMSRIVSISGTTITATEKGKCTVTMVNGDSFDNEETQKFVVRVVA